MKKFFKKFTDWLFRPVNAKVKTNGIIISLFTIFVFSIILCFFTKWWLCLIPIGLLLLTLYCAKLPVKVEKQAETKKTYCGGNFNATKNKKK